MDDVISVRIPRELYDAIEDLIRQAHRGRIPWDRGNRVGRLRITEVLELALQRGIASLREDLKG